MADEHRGVKIGDRVPDFSLPDQSGKMTNFREVAGGKVVVLYFYPKDFTPGCTTEACAFRDNYDIFLSAGAMVVGISDDSPETHMQFSLRYHLQFLLLSDEDNTVRNLFGVTPTLGFIPGRTTFIIDKQGTVRYIFSSQFNPKKHIAESIRIIKSLSR